MKQFDIFVFLLFKLCMIENVEKIGIKWKRKKLIEFWRSVMHIYCEICWSVACRLVFFYLIQAKPYEFQCDGKRYYLTIYYFLTYHEWCVCHLLRSSTKDQFNPIIHPWENGWIDGLDDGVCMCACVWASGALLSAINGISAFGIHSGEKICQKFVIHEFWDVIFGMPGKHFKYFIHTKNVLSILYSASIVSGWVNGNEHERVCWRQWGKRVRETKR